MSSSERTAAIEVRSVSKRFRIVRHGYAGIKGKIGQIIERRRADVEITTALENIALTIATGETVALIGRNGSGKSTLLSMIAHVMLPDSGEIAFPASQDPLHPKLAPLLELRAGFHPDLTGIQNVFFNGSILGLSRAQMQERLDEIKEFAALKEEVYDAPVRTYSSGMYIRLAFAVAVHTDPEIILVDEVLAVGDEPFQEKCYEKIAEFQREGRTILFVSHDMDAVRRVATRAVWLNQGRVEADGDVETVIRSYHRAFGIAEKDTQSHEKIR